MARIRSVDFLPEIFKTQTNKKFLSSTLDQLIQEPKLKAVQGYIGRQSAPGKKAIDGYVVEPTTTRTNYQLEPGMTFKDADGKIVDALSHIGLLNGLKAAGANTENHDRLFRSETYSWSPYIDFDKFVNYSQYFWLPAGPDSVDVGDLSGGVLMTNDFNFAQEADSYRVDDFSINNPIITIARGGSYTFNVNQPNEGFFIQAQPGTAGTMSWADNISSRNVLGVSNNGEDSGAITFNVPQSNAQDFYHNLTSIGNVDLASDERFDTVNNRLLSTVNSLSGVQDLDGKTIVFLNDTPGDAADLGWQIETGIDIAGYDTVPFSETVALNTNADRYQIFKIQLVYDINGQNPFVTLSPFQQVNDLEKFTIQYGAQYSSKSFYKTQQGVFAEIPLLTASLSTLYYQDSSDPNRFGVINIVDANESSTLDINDILNRSEYTSANGVVFTNGLKVKFRGNTLPASYSDNDYIVEGVGTGIKLVSFTDLIIPEQYARSTSAPWDVQPWDSAGLDGTLNAPLDQDYITINRSSTDRNAWSRSNRWFHIDVILKTAEYNNVTAELNNNDRANRPIIEFDADLRLFDYGTTSKNSVNIIDTREVDALSNINGSLSYSLDGYRLDNGSRVVFSADTDFSVRNKIYEVQYVDLNNDGTTVINLVETYDSLSEEGDVLLVTNGISQQGKVYSFTNNIWIESQQKTQVNQPPLFDIFDTEGKSLGDLQVYPSSSFLGTKVFSYADGTGMKDPVLGFALKYLNIDNLGDIVFENNMYTDTFVYVENSVSNDNTPISNGFLRKYTARTTFTNETGWIKSIEPSYLAQVLSFVYDGNAIELDITPKTGLSIPSVRVMVNTQFINSSAYSVVDKIITFTNLTDGDEIEINVISDEISEVGYYTIPTNLESNIFNENTSQLTLGTVRNHYTNLAQRILNVEGDINGANNLRDLGDISRYGTLIVQQSAPIALTAMFMRNKEYNFFSATEFNARQYEKFKNQLIDWVNTNDIYDMDAGEVLDAALKQLNATKQVDSAFYWSDMLAYGSDFELTDYGITAISTNTFTTLYSYNYTSANDKALLVYVNNGLLIKDADYTVASDGPRIEILQTLAVNDIVTIKEFNTTVGSGIPSTPSKMGLYPRFKPEIYTDDSYVESVDVIRGHDGSITVAMGDFSDEVLLEFEKRVYNNIKVNSIIPLDYSDVQGGKYRTTDYTDDEITQVLTPSLLSWLGWNKIDYKTQNYDAGVSETWNYSSAQCDAGEPITRGHWRGVYNCFYDTDSPHTRPWEMLGLTEQPTWWENRYGPAPYTSGNLVLWDDLEIGLIKEPGNERTDEKYARPGLVNVLPVDGEGKLLMPIDSVVSAYTQSDFKQSWALGDHGPAESAWRKSSAWPYAVQTLLALTKPAQYFSLMADRDRYHYDTDLSQYLYDSRHRIDSRKIEILKADTFKNSYINWIVDYNKYYGYESTNQLTADLSAMGVNLCYHMAAFTDKNSLKIFTDKSSPDSTNSSLLLPDESFNLLMYRNQPFDQIIYSSVIVQKTDDGYAISGNSATNPYFKIFASNPVGQFKAVTVGRTERTSTTITVPSDFTDDVVYIPYGHVFKSRQAVGDFIVSYNAYLNAQGLKFSTAFGTVQIDWQEMVKEFLYWTDQGWSTGSVVNLNPAASELEFEREFVIVDDLNNLALNEQPLDQNREPLQNGDYVVDRLDNNFKMRMIDNKIISYLKFDLTSFEHLLVLDNTSIFNDLIYDPVTGVRQQRVKLSGIKTYDWNGQLDAQGFLYNDDNVKEWNQSVSYNRGDIVKFKNSFWSAAKKQQPATEFDFNQWVKTNYGDIKKGLLPNIANKAEQQLNFYNTNTSNLENDADLLSLGLTGFRTRDYLRALDLNDSSQAHIYSDMIQSKGTTNSLNLFQDVALNNEKVSYDIYENWAVKRAEYGASASRAYIELRLDEQYHLANPSIVAVDDSQSDSNTSDQTIGTSQIYNQSEKHTSAKILPVLLDKSLDTSLPAAGFVNADDVDFSIYDLDSITDATGVVDGSLIWVAKDTPTNWNVYKAAAIEPQIITVTDNLDGTLRLTFNIEHTMTNLDILVIQDLDELVNGTHTVCGIVDDFNLLIEGQLADNQSIIENVAGNALKFISSRMTMPSDIAGSFIDNKLFASDTVWIDNHNSRTAVYKKSSPFTELQTITNPDGVANSEYGYDVAQGYNNSGMMVSDPTSNTSGEVYCFNKVGASEYIFNHRLTLPNTIASRYGESLAFSEHHGIIGAPGDNTTVPGIAVMMTRDIVNDLFLESQIFTSPTSALTSDFGKTVTLSTDENWVYISEPSLSSVHAYQKVEVQSQSLTLTMDGVTQIIFTGDTIIVNTPAQLSVTLNGVVMLASEYSFNGTSVTFTTAPDDGDIVKVSRLTSAVFTGNGSDTSFSIADLFLLTGIDSVQIFLDGAMQRPGYDYTLSGTNIVFTTAPAVGNGIVIKTDTYYGYVDSITGTSDFGSAVDTSTDGSQIVISAPNETIYSQTLTTADQDDVTGDSTTITADNSDFFNAGKSYIYDRVVERFVVHSDDTVQPITFTTARNIGSTGAVFINGRKLNKAGYDVMPDYSVSGNTITFLTDIAVGDFIDIDTTEFNLLQSLQADITEAGATFGNAVSICKSKCSVYIGSENANGGEGSVTRVVNETRMYGSITSTIQNLSVTVGNSLRINNVEIIFTGSTVQSVLDDIIASQIPNIAASLSDGYLTIELKNKSIQSIANKLDVLPGMGTTMASLGLQSYNNSQTIYSPTPSANGQFGSSVQIDLNLNQLVIAAVGGDAYLDIDTKIISPGVVFTYDLLPDDTEFSEGKLVFGQQIQYTDYSVYGSAQYGTSIYSGPPKFATAISLVDSMLVATSIDHTEPGLSNVGRIDVFVNQENKLSWNAERVQKDVVDVNLINSVYIYNNETFAVEQYLDYIDPLNGKILGAAKQNIDYITPTDPTVYASEFNGVLWDARQVGKIWWDISTVRFIDYNQDDNSQASKLWGKLYPGSSVDVYEFIESDVPPTSYEGTGTLYDETKFVSTAVIGSDNIIQNTYYFWVKGTTSVNTDAQKTLSADAIAQYITSPLSSGIAYVALIDQNVIGLYNCQSIINDTKSILHIEYDKIANDNNVFVEYDLIRENFANDFLPQGLYKKFQDSLCGVDGLGNKVPDVNLSYNRFGIEFRPRKSMFVDKFAALTSYLTRINTIMQLHTIAESRSYPLLNSEEPIPAAASGVWDEKVFNTEELLFQDLAIVQTGHTFLLETDDNSNGLWAIYEVTVNKELLLKRVQSYDTKRFWNLENWYASDFSNFAKTDFVVGTFTELSAITADPGSIAKVLENSVNAWEIYRYEADEWVRVALENGTIQFDERLWNYSVGRYGFDVEVFDAQYNDEEPVIELRKIIQAINEEILVGDLALDRNKAFMSMFNYVLSEQPHVDWLYKTSLIDVNHRVRSLSQYPVYQKDNQDYLSDYIREAKPYHTKIKDLLLSYDGNDVFEGATTDFDCPAIFSNEFNKFISPVLDDGAILQTDSSNVQADNAQWQTSPWDQWYANYKLNITGIEIINAGSGYTFAPIVTVTGDSLIPAELRAVVAGTGEVKEIVIDNPGSGYVNMPTITITGGNGTGATATAVTGSNLVRTLNTTIKYDRYEYESNVVVWTPDSTYDIGQLVRVNGAVFKILDDTTATVFDPSLHELVDVDTLSGIDRTTGYYVSDVNNPGLDLSLLINGIAFPGVEVEGVGFDQNTGMDVAAYDIVSFDNFDIGPEGLPTYSEDLIDTVYESKFLDTYLGTRPTDINVIGGEFIDTYHSHAPEELIPGAMFDTLDIKVFSRPGSDYNEDGHSFAIQSISGTASATTSTFSFVAVANHSIEIVVVNMTTGATLYEINDYIIDWPLKIVTITNGIAAGDDVKLFVYEIGGGNQLYRDVMVGSDIVGSTFTIPVNETEIYKIIMFSNGVEISTSTAFDTNQTTTVTITDTLSADDFITVTVFGSATPQYEESYPVTTLFNGSDTLLLPSDALTGKNRHNAIVEVNGLRLRPQEASRSIASGTAVNFLLPSTGGIDHDLVAANEVSVYVGDTLLALNIDYTLSPASPAPATYGTSLYGAALYGSNNASVLRYVILSNAPAIGTKVEVYVRTETEYQFNADTLALDTAPQPTDIIAVTTFKDVRELDILTETYVGPTATEDQVVELYDSAGYDSQAFDSTSGVNVSVNVFETTKIKFANANRLWVTLNGRRLAANDDYRVDGKVLELLLPVIADTDVLSITSITDGIITDGAEFRIFKDMRDSVGMYKISETTVTALTQDLNADDDIIYVRDASVLGQPNLFIAKFGILTIDGERITYRERDLINNTVSGLRRGTAGTGAAELHSASNAVYDISSKSFVQWDYDKIWYEQGSGNASNGIPLQDQTTIPAIFIKK